MAVHLSRPRALLAAAITGLALVLLACTGGDASRDAIADVGPEHVHGVGVNPADGSRYVATHTGLFRMPRGSDDSERVGDRLQDTMGFAVAGPDRFLASGHPDLRDDLPPLLGLVESSDAGRSWEPVSLLGEADFHALRVSGSRVVGYDASGGRLMASADGGREWSSVGTPGEVTDLALDPDDPTRIVATGDTGVITTTDEVATWTRLPGGADLLAWPVGDALYGFSADGEVLRQRGARRPPGSASAISVARPPRRRRPAARPSSWPSTTATSSAAGTAAPRGPTAPGRARRAERVWGARQPRRGHALTMG